MEIGSQESMTFPIWIIVGFQQRDRQDSQSLTNDTFSRLTVTSAQCIIGTEKYRDAGMLLNYDDHDYSQGYGRMEEAFRALTKDDIFKPYISDHDFRSSNARTDDIGYTLYVPDTGSQQNFTAAQSIEVEFKFDAVVPNDLNGFALVLTNRLVSISSDGQRHFDLIQVQFFHNYFVFFQC